MLDFIVEHVWIFVIVGAVIILTTIGFIVDKFIINKDNNKNNSNGDTVPEEPVVEENTDEVGEQPVENSEPISEQEAAPQEAENQETVPEVADNSNETEVVAEEVPSEETDNQIPVSENENADSVSDETKKKDSPWEV